MTRTAKREGIWWNEWPDLVHVPHKKESYTFQIHHWNCGFEGKPKEIQEAHISGRDQLWFLCPWCGKDVKVDRLRFLKAVDELKERIKQEKKLKEIKVGVKKTFPRRGVTLCVKKLEEFKGERKPAWRESRK